MRQEHRKDNRPEWVVLIYLAGDNNLSEECVYALNQMKQGLPGGRRDRAFEVIVQFDPVGRGNPTRRFQINNPDADEDTLESDELRKKRRIETDTGSPEALLAFLLDSIEDFPAKHYMVVLAGHGAGASEGFFLQDDARPLSTIPSSFPVDLLKMVFKDGDLQNALKEIRSKIDILGFDACMMSTLEICYQLRGINILDMIVGSEGFTLNTGWPYKEILSILSDNRSITPDKFARKIVDEYIRFYRDYYLGGLSVDMSVLKLSRVQNLVAAIDELACALIEELKNESPGAKRFIDSNNEPVEDDGHYDEYGCKPFQDAILLAHWAVQSYNGEQCVDLYDFCDLLRKRWYPVSRHCKRLMNLIKQDKTDRNDSDRLVEKSCYTGAAFQHSHGVSIYFPWADLDLDPSYEQLDFGEDSEWLGFLKLYLKATKRHLRAKVIPKQDKGATFRPTDQRDGRSRFRATPPGNKGTEGRVHSMRNPPTAFSRNSCPRENGKRYAASRGEKSRASKRGQKTRQRT